MRTAPLGVSLVEVLISMALGVLIITMVAFTSFDYLKSNQYVKENEMLVALLQKTRSRSINNVDGVQHNLHIDTSTHTFTIFRGAPPYVAAATDEIYTYDSSLGLYSDNTCSTTISTLDISFSQLYGVTSGHMIYMGDGKRCGAIEINTEGRIEW